MAFEKRPAEVKDYAIDWSRHLDAGDTIQSSAWTVEDGLTKDSDDHDATATVVWLSSGTTGSHYTVTNTIVTSQGRTFERSFVVQMRSPLVG